MSQKLRPLVLSLLFLFVSLGSYQLATDYFAPPRAMTATESPAGTWQQFVIDDGKPVYLGTFSFVEDNGDFRVEANDVSPVTFPQSDFRTFAHTYDGENWGFHSDWHHYGVAWFQLKKMEDGRYEGYAYLDGEQRPGRHVLVRIK